VLIAVTGLVLFNWRKPPDMGSSFAKALTNFKRSLHGPEEIDASGKKKDSGETPPKP